MPAPDGQSSLSTADTGGASSAAPLPTVLSPALQAALHPWERAQKQRSVLLRIVRIGFIALITVVTLLTILQVEPGAGRGAVALAVGWPVTLGVALSLAAVVLLIDVLTPTKKISTLFSVFFGLLGAMLATVAVGFIVDLLASTYDIRAPGLVAAVKVLIGIALAYLGITTVLQTQDDFRLVIPYVEFAKQYRGPRPLILDSSALIDGRFIDFAGSGLVQSPIVVPRFVIEELQRLADLGDKQKRSRGRRGLDMIGKLQRTAGVDVSIDDSNLVVQPVDQMLIELANGMNGMVVTTDAALERIGQIRGVPVLNVHDVATTLRPTVVPGEQIRLAIIREGEQPGQGIGYLDDGTMVVVDDGAGFIGEDVQLVIGTSVQTSAGRIVFAKLLRGKEPRLSTPTRPEGAPPSPNDNAQTDDITDSHAPDSPQDFSAGATPEPEADGEAPTGARPGPTTPGGTPGAGPRTPFPPKPPRSVRQGTPRNPRR
jgi:uncharacterized protein YacL